MAEQTPEKPVDQAVDEETKFKTWLKEKYQIEDDPDTFKTKKSSWTRAEEELPQYQATLTALIQHIKEQQAAQITEPVQQSSDNDEERLRTLARLDPYEVTKRTLGEFEKRLETKFQEMGQYNAQVSEAAVMRREGLRRAHEIVTQQWPEAFDQNTDLHKMGKQIYQQEMSILEQQHPLAFLTATERAAGRLGIPPKQRRGNAVRREQVGAQAVSRGGARKDNDENDVTLTQRQKQVIAGVGVDEKTYKEALKNRRQQAKKQDEE